MGKFLADNEYIDLVGSIAKENNRLSCWCTWLFSKNRFNSPLKDYLYYETPFKKSLSKLILRAIFLWTKIVSYKLRNSSSAQVYFGNDQISLIKTFSYQRSYLDGSFKDPFFKDLQLLLEKEGKKVITITDPVSCHNIAIKYSNANSNIHPFYLFLNVSDLLLILFQYLYFLLFDDLKGDFNFKGLDISPSLKRIYRQEIADPNVIHSLMMYHSIKRLIQKVSIERLIYTYENNPWERVALLAFKRFSPQTTLIGYQHSVIPLSSLNLFYSEGETEFSPVPDFVITTGAETRSILCKWKYNPSSMYHDGVSLRYDYLQKITDLKRTEDKNVLVALEGVPQVKSLVNYIGKNASSLKEWRFVIRPHPALEIKNLEGINPVVYESENIVFSSNDSLIDDLKESRIIIYWGSTVSLEAIKMGIPVIHFDIGQVGSFDPLFDCDKFKWVLDRNSPLGPTLDSIEILDSNKFQELKNAGQQYVDRYFRKINHPSFKKFYSLKKDSKW